MARKEINIFGTSFLDLLSGALAAFIILFVIVPKMSSEQVNALEELEQLDVQVSELRDILENARNSIPQDVYEEIECQVESMQNTISSLSNELEDMQRRLAAAEQENQSLTAENVQLRDENNRLRERIEQLERQTRTSSDNSSSNGISDGKVFGMNAKLGIVCMWEEKNPDVDLYVKDTSSGQVCNFNHKNTSFGNLMEDVLSRTSADDDRYELFYQPTIVPGTYEVYVNIYSGQTNWDGRPAHVNGYIVLYPGKENEKKIDYPTVTIVQKGVNMRIGTLVVTEHDIMLR